MTILHIFIIISFQLQVIYMRKRVRLRQKADSVAVNLIGVDLHVI